MCIYLIGCCLDLNRLHAGLVGSVHFKVSTS